MKTARSLLLSRPLVVAGVFVSFALAAATALLLTISTRDVSAAGARVTHTQTTLIEINQLLASLIDAETGQRGYILTGLDSYLEPYHRASSSIDGQLATLRERFAGSPNQLAALERITALVAAKNDEIRRTIELRRAKAFGPALHIVDSGSGLGTMNALREQVHVLEQHEVTQLARQSESAARQAGFFQMLGIGMMLLAVATAGTGAWLLLRRVRELETMITVCAWTKRVKFNGAWISFEDYLHSRFNLEFTHGISDEASRQLKMEAVEFADTKARIAALRHPPGKEKTRTTEGCAGA